MRAHLECGMPAGSLNVVADIHHLERNHKLATRLLTGIRYLPYEERLQRLGPPSLQWRRSRSVFSVGVVKYWNTLPASVVTALSVNVFKKR